MSESVLRFETTLRAMMRGAVLPGRQMAWFAFIGSAFYGALMGTYGGFGGHLSLAQMLFSALKVPALLLITGALCLPAFFVANSLIGLADDWPQARRALILTQAILAIVLASLSPFTLLFYASTNHYPAAILFNFLVFAAASLTAQNVLRRLYVPLIEKDVRHQAYAAWLAHALCFYRCAIRLHVAAFRGRPDTARRIFSQRRVG